METPDPQPPNLSPELYHQIVDTLTALLPPPRDDSPAALRARDHAAVAKAAAMLPVNADEADLAAQCVAARGQAEDIMRQIRENPEDRALTLRLNTQYTSILRTSASVRGLLMRVQAARRKREAVETEATQDAWTLHIAERSMRAVVDRDLEPVMAMRPEEAPAARGDQAENVSKYDLESPDVAFETRMSEHPWNRPDETAPRERVGEAMDAGLHLAWRRDQRIAENVSKYDPKSLDVAFETWMSERPWDRPGETALRERVGEAIDAGLRLAWQRDKGMAQTVSNDDPNSRGVAFETWVREEPWKRPDKMDLRTRVHDAMVAEIRKTWQELCADGRSGPHGTG